MRALAPMITNLPVAPEHISLASSITTPTGLDSSLNNFLATEVPEIPDPMMTTSAYTGNSDTCFAMMDCGTVQNEVVGFGTGKPGESLRRFERAL